MSDYPVFHIDKDEDAPIRAFDSFRVEESYNWRDDVMEITRRIVHDTDEARLSNIAEHFKVDLSEIREFIEMRRRQKLKPVAEKPAEWVGGELGYCTCCGHEGCASDIWNGVHGDWFCPNCGRQMKGELP